MTVNTREIASGPYVAALGQTDFDYTFRVVNPNQLRAWVTYPGAADPTEVYPGTDFSVRDVGEDDGGKIEFFVGLPKNTIVYIRSNYISTQDTAFESQGAYFPWIHEGQFDYVTFLIQQLEDMVNRSLRLNINDPRGRIPQIDRFEGDRTGRVPAFVNDNRIAFMHPNQLFGDATPDAYTLIEVTDGILRLDDYYSVYVVRLMSNVTTIVPPPPPGNGLARTCLIYFLQDSVGWRTVTGWPAVTTSFDMGREPVIDPTPNTFTTASVVTFDNGSRFIAGLMPTNESLLNIGEDTPVVITSSTTDAPVTKLTSIPAGFYKMTMLVSVQATGSGTMTLTSSGVSPGSVSWSSVHAAGDTGEMEVYDGTNFIELRAIVVNNSTFDIELTGTALPTSSMTVNRRLIQLEKVNAR